MNGLTAFRKITDLDDDLLEEALILSPTGTIPRNPRQSPAWWSRFSDFCESGVGVALISCLVAFSVLAVIIAAGQNPPSHQPPSHSIPPSEETTPPPNEYIPPYRFMSGFAEMAEIGVFEAFWRWSPFLTIPMYTFVAGGFLLHYCILKKCRRKLPRWIMSGILMGLCGIGIIYCEYLMYIAIGWDILGIMFLYAPLICILLGELLSIVVILIQSIRRRKRDQTHR